jgi:hypothetical protein
LFYVKKKDLIFVSFVALKFTGLSARVHVSYFTILVFGMAAMLVKCCRMVENLKLLQRNRLHGNYIQMYFNR